MHGPVSRAAPPFPPDAGIFVSAVNPHLIKNFGNNTIRKVKSDPADSRKIARYALDNWASLRQYSDMDTTHTTQNP
ncbi:MAG: IS110 family transposase [Butyricicoccus sp.]